jgi:hypothetical protein
VQASRDKTQVPAYGRLYKDGNNKNVINEYYGSLVTVNPGHVYYLAFTTTTVNKRYRDVIQDVNYRFVTDTDKKYMDSESSNGQPDIYRHLDGSKKATSQPADCRLVIQGITSYKAGAVLCGAIRRRRKDSVETGQRRDWNDSPRMRTLDVFGKNTDFICRLRD